MGNIFSRATPPVVQIGAGVAVFGTCVATGIVIRRQSVDRALLWEGSLCLVGIGILKGILYIRRVYDRQIEDSYLLPKPWRLIHGTETDISKIKTHYLRKICGIQSPTHTGLNILLLGQAECGKSSFINACLTALKQDGGICVDASVLKGTSGSVTKKLQAYHLDVRDGDKQIKLPVRLFDCRGLFDKGKGVKTKDIKHMCDGHIKDRYTINPVAHIEPEDPKFRGNPGEKDKMHCVVYVLDAQNSDQFVLKSVEKQFDVIKEHISQSNVPQVILLTKVDLLGVKRISKMFYDERVKECCEKVSTFFGLPLLSVLPQANYSEEVIPDNEKDCITMVNIWTILKRARDYAQNMSDETGSD